MVLCAIVDLICNLCFISSIILKFPCSLMVEQLNVNQRVIGSSPVMEGYAIGLLAL